MFMVPNQEKKEVITCFEVCPNWRTNFDSKKMVEGKAFLMKPKHHCHFFQWGECVYDAQLIGDYFMYPSLSQLIDKLWL